MIWKKRSTRPFGSRCIWRREPWVSPLGRSLSPCNATTDELRDHYFPISVQRLMQVRPKRAGIDTPEPLSQRGLRRSCFCHFIIANREDFSSAEIDDHRRLARRSLPHLWVRIGGPTLHPVRGRSLRVRLSGATAGSPAVACGSLPVLQLQGCAGIGFVVLTQHSTLHLDDGLAIGGESLQSQLYPSGQSVLIHPATRFSWDDSKGDRGGKSHH